MSLRVILVEDNTDFVEQLRREIAQLFPYQFKIVGTAGTIKEAYALISTTPADVVLFDIELPDGNGLTLVERLVKEKKHTFQFFFISSFDVKENLKKSMRLKSAYFVSKPLQNDELKEALAIVIENKNKNELIELLRYSFSDRDYPGTTISIETVRNKLLLIPICDIVYVKADSLGRTHFYLQDGQQLTSIKRLKHYSKLWEDNVQFILVSRTQYVNIHYIKEIDKATKQIILKNEERIQMSRRPLPKLAEVTHIFSLTRTEFLSQIQKLLQPFEMKKE